MKNKVQNKILFTGDLHLTDKKHDEYRWEIFNWLTRKATQYGAQAIVIAGDLTHQKDKHTAQLVNRVIDELVCLATHVPVHIIKGNHDYTDPNCPFFGFLSNRIPGLRWYTQPTQTNLGSESALFLPHTDRYRADWKAVSFDVDIIVLHQALKGARTHYGIEVGDVPVNQFDPKRTSALCIAGDIHMPQKVGNVTYTGSPYPINFGDDWQPRVLLTTDGKLRSIQRTTLKKAHLKINKLSQLTEADLTEGDQVKITIKLPRRELVNWDKHRTKVKAYCKKKGWELYGIEVKVPEERRRLDKGEEQTRVVSDPINTLKEFCKVQKIDKDLAAAGKELLK